MNKETKQILLGSALGDGCLYIPLYRVKAIYEERHSPKQKDYLIWKRQHFNEISGTKFYRRIRHENNSIFYLLKINTSIILDNFHKLFYPNNKKTVTKEILNMLNPLGLAVWFCDDGTYSNRVNCQLSTLSYTYQEQLTTKKWFKEKFNVNVIIQKWRKQYYLRVNKDDTKKLIDLIKPYVLKMPKCMWYKVGC